MKKMFWVAIIGVVVVGILFIFLSGNTNKGNTNKVLKPKDFFTGCQLKIYQAAAQGDLNRVNTLKTECSLDLDSAGKDDLTMLALATINADAPAIISLVKAGADPFHIIEGAGSPAVMAINRHFDPPRTEAIAAFTSAGLDFNKKSGSKPYLFYFVDFSHWQGLAYALDNGGDVNAATTNGKTLLTYITARHQIAVARWLIERGADPSRTSQYGDSALRTLDSAISRGDPATPEWRDLVAFRSEILAIIPESNSEARKTFFTEEAEQRIKEGGDI